MAETDMRFLFDFLLASSKQLAFPNNFLYCFPAYWEKCSLCHLCRLQGSGAPGFSSTKGITIFSAMSVSRENVGYTMKSMKPVGANADTFVGSTYSVDFFHLSWKISAEFCHFFKSKKHRNRTAEDVSYSTPGLNIWKGFSGCCCFGLFVFLDDFWETYQSGTLLPGCFFDHTEERRAGRVPTLYHPHKDRERDGKRRYIKGHPTQLWKYLFKGYLIPPPRTPAVFKQNRARAFSERGVTHILFWKAATPPPFSVAVLFF